MMAAREDMATLSSNSAAIGVRRGFAVYEGTYA